MKKLTGWDEFDRRMKRTSRYFGIGFFGLITFFWLLVHVWTTIIPLIATIVFYKVTK